MLIVKKKYTQDANGGCGTLNIWIQQEEIYSWLSNTFLNKTICHNKIYKQQKENERSVRTCEQTKSLSFGLAIGNLVGLDNGLFQFSKKSEE